MYCSQLYKLVKSICKELNYGFKSYSSNWILKITKTKKDHYIWGFQFPIDNASTRMICDDKAAHYDILNENKVPCFIHKYFFALPIDFKTPLALLKKYKKIVVKQNNGTGGKNIYKVCNEQEMYDAINNIAAKSGRFSISPFYEYEYEYRIILLNGKMKLCYKKIRPVVIGDGKKAIKDLIQPNITPTVDLEYVPKKNEVVQVSWKHNLGLGGIPEIVNDKKLLRQIYDLAIKAIKPLNIKFCSVDIAMVKNKLMVVEVNGGVMMEKFSSLNKQNYEIAKSIYKDAIESL